MNPASPWRACVVGAAGRMGGALIETLPADLALVAALEHPAHAQLGQPVSPPGSGQAPIRLSADLDAAVAMSDVLIDFTRPEATLAHLAACAERGCAAVIGTTGFSSAQRSALEGFASRMAMVVAPNFSVGVNLTLQLLALAARVLEQDYDIEIIEAHHRHKRDAPSGTALRMGEVIAASQGRALDDCAVFDRAARQEVRGAGSIGFATLRGGDIVGDHTVLFAGDGERIEISHRASSRATFAHGAWRAARFLRGRAVGLYDMQDVLGLR